MHMYIYVHTYAPMYMYKYMYVQFSIMGVTSCPAQHRHRPLTLMSFQGTGLTHKSEAKFH